MGRRKGERKKSLSFYCQLDTTLSHLKEGTLAEDLPQNNGLWEIVLTDVGGPSSPGMEQSQGRIDRPGLYKSSAQDRMQVSQKAALLHDFCRSSCPVLNHEQWPRG